jgi:hypothetical protein
VRTLKEIVLLFFVVLLFISIAYGRHANIFAAEKMLIFSTWEGFEADKCASIWLIRRFIDKNAVIKFFLKGEIIKEGIPFDTPDAKFRRYHNMSAFGSLLRHYNLKDPKLIYIGKIIHDIEVNTWEKKVMPETVKVQEEISNIIRNSKSNDEVIEKSCQYFDLLYRESMITIK